jgi:hypothetical protein
MPGMKVMLGRTFAGGVVTIALVLLVDWRLDDPWTFVAALVGGFACVAWALHGAMPEIRQMREENEREFQAFLRSRGRR